MHRLIFRKECVKIVSFVKHAKCIALLTISSHPHMATMRHTLVKMMTILSLYVHCEVHTVIHFHNALRWPATEIQQQLLALYNETRRWMKY